MKKALFVLVLFVAALAVNAQQDTTKKTIKTKATTTVVTSQDVVRANVKVADLLKPITDNVAKDFVGFTIKEATSVTLNGILTYEVVIIKGMELETLVYDKEGKFVKKLAK